jgi:hypothetical protein
MSQNLWTAFVAANGSNQILVDSTPDGKSWTGSRFINQWSPSTPAMAFFNGSLYIAFITDDVAVSGNTSTPSNRIFVCSTPDGVSWTPASFFNQYSKCSPALAVWGDNLYIAFIANDPSNRILYCSTPDGANWTAASDTGQTSPQAPSLIQFGNNLQMVFVSNDSRNAILRCDIQPGGTWSSASDTNQSCRFSPSLAVYNGLLYVGFVANNDTQTVLVCSSADWSSNVSVNQTSAAAPSLVSFNNDLNVGFIAKNSSLECLLTSSAQPANSSKWPTSNVDIQQQSGSGTAFALAPFACVSTLVPPRQGGLSSSANYYIWGGSCTNVVNLTGLTLTIEITSALDSTDGFSFQWNAYTPAGSETSLSTTFQQYGWVVDTNGNLLGFIDNWPSQPLRNQLYPAGSKAQQGSDLINNYFTLASVPIGTLPAGYKLVLALQNDPQTGNIIGAIWSVYSQGNLVAPPTQKILDQQPVSNDPSTTVSSAWLAPIVAFQVNLVGQANSAIANFVAGQGTLTVTSDNLMSATNTQPPCTSAQNVGTGETGDSLYSQLPEGASKLMVQPFTFGKSS